MVRYPHILTYSRNTGGGDSFYNDVTGKWENQTGTPETVSVKCRAQPFESKGRNVTDADTEHTDYQYLVYMSGSEAIIPVGTAVTIANGPDVFYEGRVSGRPPFRTQAHIKLWV